MGKPAENAIPSDALEQSGNTSGAANENNGAGDENTYVDPRMSAIESIAEGRRQALAAEGVELSGENVDDNDDPPGADEQLAAQLGEDDRKTTVATETMMVKVKVDGEEAELPLSEVVKSYQKDATASRRLQEATRLLQLAEEKEIAIAQNGNQEKNADLSSDGSPTEAKEQKLGQIKDALSKLYEGDDEGAAKALLELMDTGAKATQVAIDPAAITAQVKQQLAVESAYAQVQSDYPELFSNTERGVVLGRETYSRMQAKEQSGVPRNVALQEAAAEVAGLFGVQKAGRPQAEPQRTARDEKLERKAKLDNPGAANVVAGGVNSPAEAQNVSSVIAEMARNRLGQSMNIR